MAQKPEKTRDLEKTVDRDCELYELRNIIGLAAFAADARRVLMELHWLGRVMPSLCADLDQLLTNRHNWIECPDTLGEVLNDVHQRLGVLLEDES